MRVLVTGAGGLAGRAMVRQILRLGGDEEVFGTYRKNLPESSDRFTPIRLDLTDREKTFARLKEAEPGRVIHLAGQNHGSLDDLLRSNVIATRNLLDAACTLPNPVQVIVTGSSTAVRLRREWSDHRVRAPSPCGSLRYLQGGSPSSPGLLIPLHPPPPRCRCPPLQPGRTGAVRRLCLREDREAGGGDRGREEGGDLPR